VLTNLGPDTRTLEGAGELEFLNRDGAELGIKEITTDDGVPPEQVTIEAGDQASMSVDFPSTVDDAATRPDCAAGGLFAHVTVPGGKQPIEAWATDRSRACRRCAGRCR
jgi:hypothetical protein